MTLLFDHPLLAHILLLGGDVLATAVVGWGIIWESPSQPDWRHRIAMWLVIWGVVAETLCSITLFAFDESISQAQQGKIIALETEIAPRRLTSDQQQDIGSELWGKFTYKTVRLKSYALDTEAAVFGFQLAGALNQATISVDDCRMSGAGLGAVTTGISVTGSDKALVAALTASLKKIGLGGVSNAIPLGATALALNCKTPDSDVAATVFIGVKPIAE